MSLKSLTFSVCFLAFLVSATIAQSPSVKKPPPPPPPTAKNDPVIAAEIREKIRKQREAPKATVRGRVTYADTGMPVRYTDIGFVSADPKTRNAYTSAKTDENGEYVFKGLSAGSYYPDVKNAGVIRPSSFPPKRYLGIKDNGVPPISKAQVFPKLIVQGDGVFSYNVSVRRAAAVSGVVSYFDGEPASDLNVQIAREVNGNFVPVPGYGNKNPFRTKTDDLGYYRLSGLLPGKYKVFVTEPVRHGNSGRGSFSFTSRFGKSPFQTYYSAEQNKSGDILEVFSGQFIEEINISLPEKRLYDLSGLIIDKATGERLKGFRVDFRPVMDPESDSKDKPSVQNQLFLLSGVIGRSYGGSRNEYAPEWELRNLLPGKYIITATQVRPYRAESNRNSEEEIRYPSISQEVEIVDTNLQGIRIEVPIGGGLKFQLVTDSGKKVSRRVMVWLKDVETGIETPKRAFIKEENGVQFVDVGKIPSGEYEITVSVSGHYMTSIEGSGISGNVLEIEDGADIKDAKVFLSSQLGTVQGRVTGVESGKEAGIFPVIAGEDFLTTLMKGDQRGSQGRIGKDGKYSIRLVPGEYSLVVVTRAEIESNPQGLYSIVNERAKTARKITVGPNEVVNLDLAK